MSKYIRKRAEIGGRSFDSKEMFIGPWPLRTAAMSRLACQTDLGKETIYSVDSNADVVVLNCMRERGARLGGLRWGLSLLAWFQYLGSPMARADTLSHFGSGGSSVHFCHFAKSIPVTCLLALLVY